MEAKNYSQSIYGEYIKMFMTRIETSSTKFGIYNYGKNNEEFENYMKLIVLFILDTSIRNALERTKN